MRKHSREFDESFANAQKLIPVKDIKAWMI